MKYVVLAGYERKNPKWGKRTYQAKLVVEGVVRVSRKQFISAHLAVLYSWKWAARIERLFSFVNERGQGGSDG